MKKKYAIFAAIGLVLASLFAVQPANAATVQTAAAASGTWQPYGSNFTLPSNWYCGATYQEQGVYRQACVVRSGAYVQAATVVRNTTNTSYLAFVAQSLYSNSVTHYSSLPCAKSGVAAKSVSVCFGTTIYSPSLVRNSSAWWGSEYGDLSPWA